VNAFLQVIGSVTVDKSLSLVVQGISAGMADTETEREGKGKTKAAKAPAGPPFTLKKWNAVAMWQWDVECDTCAIRRVQVMGKWVWS